MLHHTPKPDSRFVREGSSRYAEQGRVQREDVRGGFARTFGCDSLGAPGSSQKLQGLEPHFQGWISHRHRPPQSIGIGTIPSIERRDQNSVALVIAGNDKD